MRDRAGRFATGSTSDSKRCACGVTFHRRPDEKPSRFHRRKCCTEGCAKAARVAKLGEQAHPAEVDDERFAMSHSEIATRLGISRQMVAHHEKTAIEKLRRLLEHWKAA